MSFPIIISTNCIGANFYHNYLQIPFYSPFIWAVTSYESIMNIIQKWDKIHWFNTRIEENICKPLTYSVVVDNIFTIHYVHYFKSSDHDLLYKGASVFSNNIEEFIMNKYNERTKRMLTYGDTSNPYFICHEEKQFNRSYKDLTNIGSMKSPFKRVIITEKPLNTSKFTQDVLLLHEDKIQLPEPTILKYGNDIKTFFGISNFENKIDLADINTHQ